MSEKTSSAWTAWSTISETSEGASISFGFAESLPLQDPIPSVTYRVAPEDSLPAGEFSVSSYFSFEEGPDRSSYHLESFHVVSAAQLADGYLYSDGTSHTSACEMGSARP